MATYQCSACRSPEIPDSTGIAKRVVGERWWAPVSIPIAQAEAVALACKLGHCAQHAALIGALVAEAIRVENARRTTLPGTVEVRHVLIEAEPFEPIAAPCARREGRPLVDRVREFVAGSALSATVELDLGHRRARVTMQLLAEDGAARNTVIETPRLVHLTAQELVVALRDRAADQAR